MICGLLRVVSHASSLTVLDESELSFFKNFVLLIKNSDEVSGIKNQDSIRLASDGSENYCGTALSLQKITYVRCSRFMFVACTLQHKKCSAS